MKNNTKEELLRTATASSFETDGDQAEDLPKAPASRSLVERVLDIVRTVTGLTDIEPDEDGDLCLFYAGIPIFITIRNDEPSVLFHSPLLQEMKEDDPELLQRLNQINSVEQRLQVFLKNNTVFATRKIRIFRFNKDQVITTFRDFSYTVERIKPELELEFGKSQVTPGIQLSAMVH